MNWTDQTTDTTQRTRTHIFKILNTIHTICGENCITSSWVQVSLQKRKYKCVIQSMWIITAWHCRIPNTVDEIDDDMWNGSETDEDIRGE